MPSALGGSPDDATTPEHARSEPSDPAHTAAEAPEQPPDWLDRALDRIASYSASQPFRALLMVVMPIAAAPRLWAMWRDQGVFWPDEIYQTIEQAHRLAFGYGFLPWEFRDGARSWVFPGALGVLLKVASWFGVTTGEGLVLVAKAAMVALGCLAVYGAMRIARSLTNMHAAVIAGAACALYPANIVYGSRCMSEMASATLIVLSVALAIDAGEGTKHHARQAIFAAIFATLAIYVRYQSGVIGIFVFLLIAVKRRWRDLALFTATALVLGLAGGLLDRITWGHWFHSFVLYIRFNWIEGRAAAWGVAPESYYWDTLTASTGRALWLGVLGGLLALRRTRLLPIALILFYEIHVRIPHKEFRFLMPIVPLACGVVGVGYGELLAFIAKRKAGWSAPLGYVASAIACLTATLLTNKLFHITLADMGAFLDHPEVAVMAPWHHDEGPNSCLWAAGKRDDLCGIAIIGTPIISVGGYAYLHRDVPMIQWFDPSVANYAAIPRLTPPPDGYRVVEGFPEYVLVRRDGPCAPAPYWYSRQF